MISRFIFSLLVCIPLASTKPVVDSNLEYSVVSSPTVHVESPVYHTEIWDSNVRLQQRDQFMRRLWGSLRTDLQQFLGPSEVPLSNIEFTFVMRHFLAALEEKFRIEAPNSDAQTNRLNEAFARELREEFNRLSSTA